MLSPARARSAGGVVVMSRPAKRIVPASGDESAGDALHQRALAGAVRPDEPVDLRPLHGEVHAGQGLELTESLGDSRDLEQRHQPFRPGVRTASRARPKRPTALPLRHDEAAQAGGPDERRRTAAAGPAEWARRRESDRRGRSSRSRCSPRRRWRRRAFPRHRRGRRARSGSTGARRACSARRSRRGRRRARRRARTSLPRR